MGRLRQNEFQCKCPLSERFTAILPHVLTLLEGEWRQGNRLMNTGEQALFRQAHRALGRLHELQDGAL